MIFKKLVLEYTAFDEENLSDLTHMLRENCEQKRDSGPMADLEDLKNNAGQQSSERSVDTGTMTKKRRKGGLRRDQGCVVRDAITALALCHNVTPTFPNPENKSIVEYQASSPDEIALVKFAESLDMKLMERD